MFYNIKIKIDLIHSSLLLTIIKTICFNSCFILMQNQKKESTPIESLVSTELITNTKHI